LDSGFSGLTRDIGEIAIASEFDSSFLSNLSVVGEVKVAESLIE
jgi:hypothetical protein